MLITTTTTTTTTTALHKPIRMVGLIRHHLLPIGTPPQPFHPPSFLPVFLSSFLPHLLRPCASSPWLISSTTRNGQWVMACSDTRNRMVDTDRSCTHRCTHRYGWTSHEVRFSESLLLPTTCRPHPECGRFVMLRCIRTGVRNGGKRGERREERGEREACLPPLTGAERSVLAEAHPPCVPSPPTPSEPKTNRVRR